MSSSHLAFCNGSDFSGLLAPGSMSLYLLSAFTWLERLSVAVAEAAAVAVAEAAAVAVAEVELGIGRD